MQILLKRIYLILFHFISFHGRWFNPLPQQKEPFLFMQLLLKRIYFILFHFIHFIFHLISFHGRWFNPLPQQKGRGEGVHTMLNISDIPNDSFLSMDMKKVVTEILGWCPVGSVLPYGEKVPL